MSLFNDDIWNIPISGHNDPDHLYLFAHFDDPTLCKVGRSIDVGSRASQLKNQRADKLYMVVWEGFGWAEKQIHRLLWHNWDNGEWFDIELQKAIDKIEGFLNGEIKIDHQRKLSRAFPKLSVSDGSLKKVSIEIPSGIFLGFEVRASTITGLPASALLSREIVSILGDNHQSLQD